MAVQIIDEKAGTGVALHPAQHKYQVFICKMMAEQ